ncbi:MAG: T9SS type A sorting domain-containing protein, partial [Flavobacteriales bacterium]
EFQEEQSEEHTMVRMDDFAEILLYPNPGNGEMINLEIDGIESGKVDVYLTDAMGKLLATKQYYVEGHLQTQWVFDTDLAFGLYMIEFVYDGKKVSQRIIIE